MTLTADRRFRLANDYAFWQGFVSGFPNFHEADYGQGVVGGIFFLPASVAEWRDVPRDTYGVYHIEHVPEMFRAAATYAASQGYVGAYPNCHQQDYGTGVVYGTIMLKPGMAQWRDVPRATLGNPAIDNVGAMMRAASDYAAANGFAAAFPTFHQADYGAGVVYGLVLIPIGNAEWRDVLVADLFFLQPQDERTCVVLCQLRNADGSLSPVMAQPNFYQQYFFGIGNGGLRDYYADVTHHRVNLVGDIFGWLDIGHTVTEHAAVTGQAQRIQAFNWGMQAARAAGFSVDSYPRQVVIINIDTDWGGVNRGRSMLLPHSVGSPWSHSRAMHEFGHVLDLDDAFKTTRNAAGMVVDTRYLDQHCIMSYATSGSRFSMSLLGQNMEAGPGLNGVYTNRLGGIPPSRLYSVPAIGAAHTVTLAPLTHAEEEGVLLVQIPPTLARPNTYWVELHDKSNWDRAIPGARIAVHESRGGDQAFALEVNGVQSLSSPTQAAFITPDGSMGIRFVAAAGLNVTVRIWELGPSRLQQVRVALVVFDPPGDDLVAERVVIRNDRSTTVSMAGWCLRDEKQHPVRGPFTYLFPNVTLSPGEDLVVWTKAGHADSHNLFWGLNHAVWNNRGGDTAVLLDNSGTVVSRFTY